MGACVCLLVGCGRCMCLNNSVPKCAVDFPVLLGKVGMFESRIVVGGLMCPAHRCLILH